MFVSIVFGEGREAFDEYKNVVKDGMSWEASRKDCMSDREANQCGLGSRGRCQEGCARYWVPGLPPEAR